MITAEEANELSKKKVAYYNVKESKKVRHALKKIEKKIIAEAEHNQFMLQYDLGSLDYLYVKAIADLLKEAGYEVNINESWYNCCKFVHSLNIYWNKE